MKKLTKADHAAMARAIDWIRTKSPGPNDAKLIDHVLEREGFARAGEYAADIAQHVNLKLRSFECAPCNIWGNVDQSGAIALRDRLLAAGISLFEPNPTQALAEVEHKRRNA
jgi:hypothetical protein